MDISSVALHSQLVIKYFLPKARVLMYCIGSYVNKILGFPCYAYVMLLLLLQLFFLSVLPPPPYCHVLACSFVVFHLAKFCIQSTKVNYVFNYHIIIYGTPCICI